MLMPSIFGEDLFDNFLCDFDYPAKRAQVPYPNVMKTDIKETKEGFDIEIDLPGYKKEDVKAELKEGYLTINAESQKKAEEKGKDGKYLRRERYVGSCSRSFYVGEDIENEDIKAKFEDGILHLFVPKKEPKPQVEEKKYIPIEG